MALTFESILSFPRGTLRDLLIDAYSFDPRYRAQCGGDWRQFDDFFYDHPAIAEKYGFITALDGAPVGHISWDPRHLPAYAEIGHNCIISSQKGKGCGKIQLAEAVRRIRLCPVEKIIVSTNSDLISAQRNYESVGFKLVRRDAGALPDLFYEYRVPPLP